MIKKIREWNRHRINYTRQLGIRFVSFIFDRKDKGRQRPFEASEIKKILLLRTDNKIGDMIVSTALLKALHGVGKNIDVVAGSDNSFIIEEADFVDTIYSFKGKLINIVKLALKLKKEKYDLVLDFGDYAHFRPKDYVFISLMDARYTLGFNKSMLSLYNANIDYPPHHHITERYKYVITLLAPEARTLDYEYIIKVPSHILAETEAFLALLESKKYIVINPFAASSNRNMSSGQLKSIVEKIKSIDQTLNIIIIGPSERLSRLNVDDRVIKSPFQTFYSAVVIVQNAILVISPDTSWVHVARIYRKPLIALYGNKAITNKVWGPNYDLAVQLSTTERKISAIPVGLINREIEKHFL